MGYLDRLADLDITDSEAQLRAVTRFYSLPLLMEREVLTFGDLKRCIKDALAAETKLYYTEGVEHITADKILWILQDLHILLLEGESSFEDGDGLEVSEDTLWAALQQLHDDYVRSVTIITLTPVHD
tara:strand:- start:291 stop:671 length:381 start_codon:yes stop_codon:yes gene_type:complete